MLLQTPKMQELLKAIIPYSERHFERLDRLCQQAKFVSYTVSLMRNLEAKDAPPAAADGTLPTPGKPT